ncbi:MAG: hypothetical protein WCR55_14125 [Lentisphaerota bacterium]
MATQKFYNVKKRESVTIDEKKCTKIVYKKEGAEKVQERYALRAQDTDGTKLTRFISKKAFDTLKCPLDK